MSIPEEVHILLIDDDPEISDRILNKLNERGWKVTHPPDEETGIEQCIEGTYDVILLDCGIHGLNGISVLERLKTHEHTSPIIMFVDAGCENNAVEALRLDVDDYLIKDGNGVFLELITPTIERTLQRREAALEKETFRKQLEESERKYRSLVENLNDVVFTMDHDGIITYVSPSVERLYSYSPDDLVGIHFSKIVHPEDYPGLYQSFQDTLDGKLEPFEFRVSDGNGNEHYVQTSSRLAYHDDQVVGTTGVLRDITELKKKHLELEAKTRELGERVKELHCLYEITDVIDRADRLEDIYRDIVSIIPSSWQFPDKTFVRITIQDDEFYSTPFRETKWRQSQDVCVLGEVHGIIEVFVDGEQLDPDTQPFLKEEQDLLNDICQRLGKTIQRIISDKTIHESEERFHNFFEYLPEYCYIVSPEGAIIDINSSAVKRLGYTKEELIDESIYKIYTPEYLPRMQELLEHWKKTGTIKQEQVVIQTKEGEKRTVLLNVVAVKDNSGKIIHSISIQTDITDRLEKELKYTQILNTTRDGFWVVDGKGNILEVNPATSRILGYTQEEMGMMSVSDIDAIETPEETQIHLMGIRDADSVLFETKHKKKDGDLVDVEVSISFIPTGGGFFIAFTRDITDRKQAESERETTLQLLTHLNEQTNLHELMSQVTQLLREWSGCEVVSIRLKEGEDYPYYTTTGLPNEFVLSEITLCETDTHGGMIRDSMGDPVLECMCGGVIRGEFDPTLPFFTEKGSFWTNSMTEFLSSTGDEELNSQTRKRCHIDEYESVALIPLRHGSEVIGLIQFNDSHRDRLDEYTISFLERLAAYITLGVSERLTANAVKESEKNYRELVELSPELIAIHKDGIVVFINEAGLNLLGAESPDQIIGKPVISFVASAKRDIALERIRKGLQGEGRSPVYEQTLTCLDGTEKYIEVVGTPMNYYGERAILIVAHDITARKQAEKELSFQSLLLNQIQDLITATDLEGTITYVNEAFCRQLGKSRETLIGHHVIEYGESPDLGASQREIIERTTRDGEWRGEVVNFRQDGTEIVLDTRTQLLYAEIGEPIGMLGVSTDITERRFYEEALKQSEEKYRLVVDNAHEAILITQGGVIKYANPRIVDLIGYPLEEVISRNYLDFIHPDDYQILEEHDERREKLIGPISTLVIRIINNEGAIRWIEVNSAFIEWGGERASLDFINDITNRKAAENALLESERKYRGLFDSSMDVVFVSTIEGRFIDINRAGEDFFGYTREELLKLDVLDVYYNPPDRLSYQQIMAEKGYVMDYEVVFKRKDGTPVESFLTATVRQDAKGKILGYHGIIKDVTELKRTQDQLIRAQKMEAIGTLAAGIAHDFNNILATIMGYSSFLKGKVRDNREIFGGFDAIEKASIRASNLTSQLLAYTRKSMREVKIIDINTIATEVTDLISKTFEKSIHIQLEKESDLPMIEGDGSQIYQVIMNCTVNAQHAMPNGGVLEIETYTQEITEAIEKPHFTIEPGRYVSLKISDTGVGMESETLSRIFEPYFTTRGGKGGSGLGMSVVFGIVKSHRGYIDVRSEPGHGTEVTISFPVADETETVPEERVADVEGGTETILVVDDEEQILTMTKAFLEESGYAVQTALSGKEGIQIVKNQKLDLIILDVKMPDMDGMQVLRELMLIDPDVRVLISTGYVDTARKDDLTKMGAKGLIKKPFKADDIKREIRRIFEES